MTASLTSRRAGRTTGRRRRPRTVVLAGLGAGAALACCVGLPAAALGVVAAVGAGTAWVLGGSAALLGFAGLAGAAALARHRRRPRPAAPPGSPAGGPHDQNPKEIPMSTTDIPLNEGSIGGGPAGPAASCSCCAPSQSPLGQAVPVPPQRTPPPLPRVVGCGPTCLAAGECVCGDSPASADGRARSDSPAGSAVGQGRMRR